MEYLNKFTRKKISIIQEVYQEESKRKSSNRKGLRNNVNIKTHKTMLSSDNNDETEHEKEIEKRAKILYKYGKFKTYKEAVAAARQEQNRKEGK